MAFIRANSIVMHYELYGKRGAPRLVLINSLGTDFRIWNDVVAGLVNDYEILACDMRGHGLTEEGFTEEGLTEERLAGEAWKACTIALLAEDLMALMDAVGWHDGVTPVGLSVGGLVAMHCARHAPQRLARIVLMDTAAKIGTSQSWNSRIDAVMGRGISAVSGTIMKNWFTDRFAAVRAADFNGYRMMLERMPARGYAAVCAALRAADLKNDAAEIRLPALVMAGDGDRSTPPDLVRGTARLIAGARFELIRDAGHLPCIEQPGRVVELLSRFMEE